MISILPMAGKYRQSIWTAPCPYDGIPEAMDRLHAIGYETAVCSNSNIRYIKMCVSAIGLKDKMDYLQELEAGMDHKGQSLGKLFKRGFSGKSGYGR